MSGYFGAFGNFSGERRRPGSGASSWHPSDYFTDICFVFTESTGITSSGGNLTEATNLGTLELSVKGGSGAGAEPAWAVGTGLTFDGSEICRMWDTNADSQATWSDIVDADAHTLIIVLEPDDHTTTPQIVMEDTGSYQSLMFLEDTYYKGEWKDSGGSEQAIIAATAGRKVFLIRHNSGSLFCSINNGTENENANAGQNTNLNGAVYFGARSGPSNGFAGKIQGLYGFKTDGNPAGLSDALDNLVAFHTAA